MLYNLYYEMFNNTQYVQVFTLNGKLGPLAA